jgi:selenide,water dikinase
MVETENIKLTQFSHGAGCGCKIAPDVLEKMLHTEVEQAKFKSLLVGNESKDDAAVFEIGNGMCIISTTDFFMPIVDDPFTFGSIASVNAISDVYAMGGAPIMAIAILGWPIGKISPAIAKKVLEGSREICANAGSIDCPEPIFGLAVTGTVKKENLKRNDTARANSLLYLTKPLGIGIVTTAQKKGIVHEDHLKAAVDSMLRLNSLGKDFGTLRYVNAMTDVTGFGLLGHLCEVCEGSGLSAEINVSRIPVFDFLDGYLKQKSTPGGTGRNWSSYGNKISALTEDQKSILADPQTSGGLLVSVNEEDAVLFEDFMKSKGLILKPFGRLVSKGKYVVSVD